MGSHYACERCGAVTVATMAGLLECNACHKITVAEGAASLAEVFPPMDGPDDAYVVPATESTVTPAVPVNSVAPTSDGRKCCGSK